MTKYTIAQILTAWEAAFGEDMMTEYPGFIQRLTEEQSEKKWEKDEQKDYQSSGVHTPLALARGQWLQERSGKLQASSRKLDKIKI